MRSADICILGRSRAEHAALAASSISSALASLAGGR